MSNYTTIFTGKDGDKRGSDVIITQNSILNDLTFSCYFEDGTDYTFGVGDTMTGFFQDKADTDSVYGVAGTLTPTEGANTFTWARDATDTGQPGDYALAFKVVSAGADPDYSILVSYTITASPDGSLVPAVPLVGVAADDAAWLAVQEANGENVGDKINLINPATADNLVKQVADGSLTDGEAPTDGAQYVRQNAAWVEALIVSNFKGVQENIFTLSELPDSGDWGFCSSINELQANIDGDIRIFVSGEFPIVEDMFLTNLSGGSVNGTSPEPGPGGNRVVTDTDNVMETVGQSLSFTQRVPATFGDPGLWYEAVSRNTGIVFSFTITPSTSNKIGGVGFDNSQSSLADRSAFYFNSNGTIQIYDNGAGAASVRAYNGGGAVYDCMVILRSTGAWYLIREDGEYFYNLIFVGAVDANATVYPAITNRDQTATIKNVVIKQLENEWSDDYGPSSARIETPISGNRIDAAPNAITEFTWTAATGETVEFSFRIADSTNRWYLECVQATGVATLYSEVGGVPTPQGTTTTTFTNGSDYRILVQANGTTIKIYINSSFEIQKVSATYLQGERGASASGFTTGANLASWPLQVPPPFV